MIDLHEGILTEFAQHGQQARIDLAQWGGGLTVHLFQRDKTEHEAKRSLRSQAARSVMARGKICPACGNPVTRSLVAGTGGPVADYCSRKCMKRVAEARRRLRLGAKPRVFKRKH